MITDICLPDITFKSYIVECQTTYTISNLRWVKLPPVNNRMTRYNTFNYDCTGFLSPIKHCPTQDSLPILPGQLFWDELNCIQTWHLTPSQTYKSIFSPTYLSHKILPISIRGSAALLLKSESIFCYPTIPKMSKLTCQFFNPQIKVIQNTPSHIPISIRSIQLPLL